MGRANKSTFLYQAMQIPNGVPITTPIAQPPSAICKDDAIWLSRVAPSGAVLVNFFINVFATVIGPGRVAELVSFNTSQQNHQTARNPTMDMMDRYQKLSFFFIFNQPLMNQH